MSSEAVNWVRDVVDCPANLVGVSLVVASYMDPVGRGCRASAATIARGAKKSKRQVERDLALLRKLGIIAPGDQRLVAHLDPTERPVVYDFPGAAEWIVATAKQRARARHPTDTGDGTPHRHGRRHPHRHVGSEPTVTHDGQDPPSGVDRAESAQGSAPRFDGKSRHPFLDDGHGNCTHCGLPQVNRFHKEDR